MKTTTLYFVFAVLAFTACKNKNGESVNWDNQKTNIEIVFGHNSQNSLDLAGTYKGILPCADCKGIVTKIELNKDLSYTRTIEYLGKTNGLITSSGSFSWDKSEKKLLCPK